MAGGITRAVDAVRTVLLLLLGSSFFSFSVVELAGEGIALGARVEESRPNSINSCLARHRRGVLRADRK